MMGEFTDTMGQPAQSDGTLYAAMKEYEDKLMAADAENAALPASLATSVPPEGNLTLLPPPSVPP